MRIADAHLDEVRERGYTLVEGFMSGDALADAQEALWLHYPRPEEYFADPEKHAWATKSQFAGLYLFPFKSWALNSLALHDDLADAASRLLGTDDLEFYKGELWAKYSGAIDYDQRLHRDYANHSLVVPRRDGRWMQMTTFLLLSDVTEADGPTRLVPLPLSADVPFTPVALEPGAFADDEVAATGPAGTLLIYRTDILHRGSDFGGEGRARFTLLADFKGRGPSWSGKRSWPDVALNPDMSEVLVHSSVRQRNLLGFPPPGHEYWNEQTLADVTARYPGIDVTSYAT
jgi:hypothetical protein